MSANLATNLAHAADQLRAAHAAPDNPATIHQRTQARNTVIAAILRAHQHGMFPEVIADAVGGEVRGDRIHITVTSAGGAGSILMFPTQATIATITKNPTDA